MEILAAAIGTILGCGCNNMNTSLEEKCKYIKSSKEEVQKLRDKRKELIAQVNDVKAKLLIVEWEGKTRTRNVENWLNKANGVISEVDVVQTEAEAPNSCLSGVLPNCCSKAKLGKQMLKLIEEMTNLLNACKFSDEELAFFVQETGRVIPTTRLIGKTTAEKNLEMVWECLIGDEVQKIGVYGMGGVGKTTLMKNINNRLLQQQSRFESVLWVTVSKDVNAQKLQKQIAGVVNLDLSVEPDEATRSSLLLSALCRRGKFVLILDDIWEAFDLLDLGVPEPTKENACKIILTTRSREVCEGMLCQKYVKVEQLCEDEAWELFLANVGEELVPQVENFAKAVVAECCGLPLAIVTIGRSMRRKDVDEWRVALSDLKESTSLNMAMEEKVIQSLKFSYDQLRENHQKCFLYCALYPEDNEIDTSELIEYWVMEGLVKGSSKEDEMLRGRVILNILKRCCMLEEVSLEGGGYVDDRDLVKMHDLIRDMALYITKSKPKFMVKAGFLYEVPHEGDWSEDLERVSFMGSSIKDISIIPKCPKLLTLVLSKTWALHHVAHGFFMHMNSLMVLDLSGSLIESLPDSASDLVNLRSLLLDRCPRLVRVPLLSKLQSLRVLKLTHSAIEELPHGMEMLVNLRSLDLTYNSELKEMIPSGLISKFSLLQELQLLGIKPEYVYARERGGDFVQELSSLTHLENLQIEFYELSDFIAYGVFGNFERLKKYFIDIGIPMEAIDSLPEYFSKYERFVWLSNSMGIPCNALSLPKRTQFLRVQYFNGITRLSELSLNDLSDLSDLFIISCNSVKCIVPEDEDGIFLQRVENMVIDSCESLSKIYEKAPVHGAFPCLKSLAISDCHNIKILLSSRLLQQLHNLEEISVVRCEELEELVIADGDERGEGICCSTLQNSDAIPILPRLRKLELKYLPKLKSTWSRLLMYSNSWRSVSIARFDQLDRLFSTSLLQHVQNLEEIIIGYCAELEELIAEDEEIDYTVTLPRLQKLSFSNLQKLKSIWKGVMICDSLQTVEVYNCPELKRLPQFNEEHQTAPPSLGVILGSREWWDSLEWSCPCPEHLFGEGAEPFFSLADGLQSVFLV